MIECVECGESYADGYRCRSKACRVKARLDRFKSERKKYTGAIGVPVGWKNCYVRAYEDFKTLPPDDENVLIVGPNGTGKTHMMAAMASEALEAAARSHPFDTGETWTDGLRWVDAADIFLELRESFREKSKRSELEIVKRFTQTYQVLFIDDLFAEKVTEWTLPAICQILRQREQYNRRTVITSNIAPDELADVSPRIKSLLSGYHVVEVSGRDRRESRK